MPVEILPEGYTQWFEVSAQPNVLFIAVDPHWKTKTGSSNLIDAILYRGGPGFLHRSTDGGVHWFSILPSTAPTMYNDSEVWTFSGKGASYGRYLRNTTPTPTQYNVTYASYAGNPVHSGEHYVIAYIELDSFAYGGGTHYQFAAWLLYTTNDWVTHTWKELYFIPDWDIAPVTHESPTTNLTTGNPAGHNISSLISANGFHVLMGTTRISGGIPRETRIHIGTVEDNGSTLTTKDVWTRNVVDSGGRTNNYTPSHSRSNNTLWYIGRHVYNGAVAPVTRLVDDDWSIASNGIITHGTLNEGSDLSSIQQSYSENKFYYMGHDGGDNYYYYYLHGHNFGGGGGWVARIYTFDISTRTWSYSTSSYSDFWTNYAPAFSYIIQDATFGYPTFERTYWLNLGSGIYVHANYVSDGGGHYNIVLSYWNHGSMPPTKLTSDVVAFGPVDLGTPFNNEIQMVTLPGQGRIVVASKWDSGSNGVEKLGVVEYDDNPAVLSFTSLGDPIQTVNFSTAQWKVFQIDDQRIARFWAPYGDAFENLGDTIITGFPLSNKNCFQYSDELAEPQTNDAFNSAHESNDVIFHYLGNERFLYSNWGDYSANYFYYVEGTMGARPPDPSETTWPISVVAHSSGNGVNVFYYMQQESPSQRFITRVALLIRQSGGAMLYDDPNGAPETIALDWGASRTQVNNRDTHTRAIPYSGGGSLLTGRLDGILDPTSPMILATLGTGFGSETELGANSSFPSSRGAAAFEYSGDVYVYIENNARTSIDLYKHNSGADTLDYVSSLPFSAGAEFLAADIDSAGSIAVAAASAGAIMVAISTPPYSSWTNVTSNHRTDLGVTGLIILE